MDKEERHKQIASMSLEEAFEYDCVNEEEAEEILESIGIAREKIPKLRENIEIEKRGNTTLYKGISKSARELGVSRLTILKALYFLGLF